MVTQIAKEESFYRAAFRRINENESATWLKHLRENAFDRFEQIGFPTPENEEWKYTNVAPISRESFEISFEKNEVEFENAIYEEAKQSQLVFVNGVFIPGASNLSALPENVVALNLKDALRDEKYEDLIKEHLARVIDYNENGFTALNTAFVSDCAFLLLPRDVKVETPIHILFVSTENHASFPRVLIVAGKGSEATIIENYVSVLPASAGGYDSSFTNSIVEIVLADDAKLTHYRVQRESKLAFHVGTTRAELNRGSLYNVTSINIGALLSRHNVSVKFNQTGGEAWVDGLYFVTDGQHTDTHSLIDHAVPHCTSHQIYKGILDGKSRAVFNGKVFVHKDAVQTDAQQTNRNLLLSKDARIDTKPQLEIYNDDVKCSHGATVGQLEDEELFYLLSRGLHPDLARNLLTYGFAEEVISKIEIESIKRQLDDAVLSNLQATLEA